MRKSHDALQVMRQVEEHKESRKQSIKSMALQLIAHSDLLGSADQVRWYLHHLFNLKVSRYEVYGILKRDLGMRYRRIVHIASQANSERNLVLRQRFALEFLRLAGEGKEFINIDER